jgi:hypothetical protein
MHGTGKNALKTRAQSAMEYLVTYGWVVLVVGIVAAILFALGLFGQSSSSTPNGCVPQPNYSCTNPIYTANGIAITVGQNTGQIYYGAWGFIASSSENIGSSGLPAGFSESSTVNMTPLGLLTPGQTITLNYGNSNDVKAGDIPSGNVPVGNEFNGYVWLGYCTTPGCTSPTSFTQVGSISVKASGGTLNPNSATSTTMTSSTTTS